MSYWWKSSSGKVTQLSDYPEIAFDQFKSAYEDDPEGTFGIMFANRAKLTITGTETAEVTETVRKWIDHAEDFHEEKEGG